MQINQIFEEDYPDNKIIPFAYSSSYYYDVEVIKKDKNEGWIFKLEKKSFSKPFEKYEKEKVFKTYKEHAEYYLASGENGKEIGLVVMGKISWNNLLRIWDIYIEKRWQRKGIGTKLLEFAENKARALNVRGIILECQSSNYPAIQFYLKFGFELSGFNLISYTNTDIERHEVRFEMSKLF
ncbi:MAG: GNAT family N-acetyltransferase [Candidatus Heimdallarchaeota archaeon]|nr:GNAT family N-acetyltransferase [Candidatus Heimdallarchaeota archaeon]